MPDIVIFSKPEILLPFYKQDVDWAKNILKEKKNLFFGQTRNGIHWMTRNATSAEKGLIKENYRTICVADHFTGFHCYKFLLKGISKQRHMF